MAQENLAAPPAILHRDKDGRPVVLVERWLVMLPCGHTTRRTPESIAARGQYVCGRCMGLYGQWVEGRLDPEWVQVLETVDARAPEPPADEAPTGWLDTAEKVRRGMAWVQRMVDEQGCAPMDEYNATRPTGTLIAARMLEKTEYDTWTELVSMQGGMTPQEARHYRQWERKRAAVLALVAQMWDELGRAPSYVEYLAARKHRRDQFDVPRPETVIARMRCSSWPEAMTRVAEAIAQSRREAA